MNFGENLQTLRKKRKLSQEEFAEKMGVSRQAVSKWESSTGFPETEKLIAISEVLNCSLDELIKGKVSKDEKGDRHEYDTLMNNFGKGISLGVLLILIGLVFFFLVQEFAGGLTGDPGSLALIVLMLFIMGAVPIFIVNGMNLEAHKKKYDCLPNFYTEDEIEAVRKKSVVTIATAVPIIIFGVIVYLLTMNFNPDSNIPMALLFSFLSLSIPNLVRNGIRLDQYDIEKYNRECSIQYVRNDELLGRISAVIMITATSIYLLISFLFDLWHISWVVFPVGGMLCGIVAIILGQDK